MPLAVPTCDDRPIRDVWLSLMWLPAGFVDIAATCSYYSVVRGTKR